MRITRVTTKTGDQGETALGGGQRLPKDHPRIEAFGTVDELNSTLGVALTLLDDPELRAELERVQHQLFDLGGDLCLREEDKARFGLPPFAPARVEQLEEVMERLLPGIPPLEEFVLPGGEPAAAQLHVARCVARRAERLCVTLARSEPVSPAVIPYLNRLSDLLFVLARVVNHRAGRGDVLWKKEHRRGAPRPEDQARGPAAPGEGG